MFGRAREDDGPRRRTGEGPASEDARRAQAESISELRAEAQRRGVGWDELVKRAGLAKASKSRLKKGLAGSETIGRMRRAMDELTGPAETVASLGVDPEIDVEAEAARAAPVARRRWVVVQRRNRELYFGISGATDDEIASTRRVRLEHCRAIRSQHADAAVLATVGPSEHGIAGAEAPSALILDVEIVYDCTKLAVRAFEQRK